MSTKLNEKAAREYWTQHRNEPGFSCAPHWATKYIGLPYAEGGRDRKGLDCWGLLRLIYKDEKGVLLPDLPGITTEGPLAIAHQIAAQEKEGWQEVPSPQDCDAVAMSLKNALHHVGIWVDADGGKVIHSWKPFCVVADTIPWLRVKGIRTIRFFRYGSHN